MAPGNIIFISIPLPSQALFLELLRVLWLIYFLIASQLITELLFQKRVLNFYQIRKYDNELMAFKTYSDGLLSLKSKFYVH